MVNNGNSDPDDETARATSEALAGLEQRGALDTVFGLLADRRRRQFLTVLDAHGETLTLADAADEVAEREHECPLSDISAETVMQVYMSLYHSHVPKLANAGVVEYDQENDLVTLVPAEECELTGALVTLIDETLER